jgi:hydroxymethylpyrimidine pyrophosphatase-like HAD family hydrolase
LSEFKILNFPSLHYISTIIWDIDGTITDPNGEINHEVAAKIINLGLNGIYHLFITGRDANWIIRNVIRPMTQFYSFPRMHDNIIFFAEVGCVILTVDSQGTITKRIHPKVKNHPLKLNTNNIRDKLKNLTYNPENLQKLNEGEMFNPVEYFVVYDADRVGWLVPRKQPAPDFPQHIWSIYKEVFATFENLRNAEGKPLYFDQVPWAEKLQRMIENEGFADQIEVEIVSTALNIVPKINNLRLGKSWAAGVALLHLWEKLGRTFTLDEIINRTVAFGDGLADFDFTTPSFEPVIAQTLERKTIQIVFVGEDKDLPKDENLRKNMIISATGGGGLRFIENQKVIELYPRKGAMVTSAVLDFLKLWDYFRSF